MADRETWVMRCVQYPASLRLGRPAVVGCRVVTKAGRTKWAVQFQYCSIGQSWSLQYGKTTVTAVCTLWHGHRDTVQYKSLVFRATRNGEDVNLPTAFSFLYEHDSIESLAMLE